ncbi:TonB-dependent receptor [Pseudoalteromonas rubra]|uniref:TonB-dependent receptor n=1 Tax=Pseudoalteromonas rubra TaxID=43658 RepID=A0A5S3X5U0_9GAMM|nr:TonB-dependent receptor [Pseudoalteromonas rubra]TMP39305.1 TonB-dependent receptor [Pseudoalteromonas rubra]
MKPGLTVSALTFALLQAYSAQVAADTAGIDQIEKITVTSTRTAKANTDLALSVGQVSEQTIADDNAQHISESLQTIPGVLINQLSGGQGHNAAVRMPINFDGYTLYLQDNIPLQSAAFYTHNALWWTSSNIGLSRLEVLRGAGTSLHGSGAVAATVNVLSKPVSADKNSLGLTLGEHGYSRINGSTTWLDDNQGGLRVSAAYLENDGWRDHNAVEKAELDVRHEYQLDDKQSLTTSLIASSLDQQILTTLSIEQFEQDPSQSGLPDEVIDLDPRRTTDYMRLSTEYLYEDKNLSVSLIPYARHRTLEHLATWQPNFPVEETEVTTFGLLALASWSHQNSALTTLGVDLEHTSGDTYSFQPTTRITTGRGAATYPQGHVFYNDTTTFKSVSPYIQHLGYLTDALSYTLGARFDHSQYEFDNALPKYKDDGFGNRSIASRKDTFSHLSPKLSLNYLLNAHSSVYVRFANAMRLPTAPEMYHLKSRQSSAQLGSLKEETSDTYELGYKANLDALSIELAYYLMDVDDAIVTAFSDLGASYRVNASSVRHKGFELGLNYQFNRAFSAALAYSQSDHEFRHYIRDEGRVHRETGESMEQDLSGNSLHMAPEYVANFRLNYTSQTIKGLRLTAEVKSIGDYYLSVENTDTYSGYTVFNLKANYRLNKRVKLHARIANLTDKTYALQNEERFGRTRIQPGMPRTAYVGISYDF